MKRFVLVCAAVSALACFCQAAVNPLASTDAVKGGTVVFAGSQPPKSLNYYLDNNVFSHQVFSMMYETLLNIDPVTAEFVPGLAKSWTVSEDKLTFTFVLDEAAKWSDGRAITAADVKWTFDAVMAPSNLTGSVKVMLEAFESPEVVDAQTVRFKAKSVHWRNLLAAGGFEILPKHAFEALDFNLVAFVFPVVSGPYRLGQHDEGRELVMERRKDWWGAAREVNRHVCNFDTVRFRFFGDPMNAFEAFKKGDVDVYAVYMSRIWNNETQGERFDKNWILKQRIENLKPVGFQGFAMNLRKPPFDDVRVRKAFAYLLDRETLNTTLMFGAYFLQRSYWEDLYDAKHPCANTEYRYDPAKALELLKEAGWARDVKSGKLMKDGKALEFTFLTRDGSTDNFLAVYSDALSKVGVQMKIVRKDFAAWMRDMDSFNFEMTWASWSSSLFKDPESMWSSAEAERAAGNNCTGFKNKEVDALIEKQKSCFDLEERNAILRRIDKLVSDEVPYVLLWNIRATRLLYWNKFGMPRNPLGKYGDEFFALSYWWYDEDSAAELDDALQNRTPLPKRPELVPYVGP